MDLLAMPAKTVLEVKWTKMNRMYKNFSQKQHYNPNYELIAVSEGPLYLQVEQEKLTLNAGDIVILLPWEQHKGWNTNMTTGEFFWVQFQTSSKLESIAEENLNWDWKKQLSEVSVLRTVMNVEEDLLLLPRRCIHIPHKFKLLSSFEQLIEEMNKMEGNYRFRCSLILGSILEMISSVLLQQQKAIQPVSHSYRIFCQTVAFLDNFFMENLNKQTIETQLDRNYEYVGQLFKKYAGITIVDYIQQLRVQRSKYLLLNSAKTVKDISEEVGFEDPFYFSKVFKKIEGCAPSQYRNLE